MHVADLQPFTTIDYPGHLACILFTGGCNMRCPYCYNFELIFPKKKLDLNAIFSFLNSRKGKLTGIVISGGEPTIHGDLPEFLKELKDNGWKVKLDTNGTNPEMLLEIIEKKLVDYVALDLKTRLNRYPELLAKEEKIERSIAILKQDLVAYELRTTVVPTLCEEKDMRAMLPLLKGVHNYYLQPFIPENTLDPKFETLKPTTLDQLNTLKEIIQEVVPKVSIRS